MYANDMLDYWDKIIEAFRNGNFSSEHLKKPDDAAYDYTLEGVNNFIQKIESMAEKIKFVWGFFWITKNLNENKEIVAEIEDQLSDLKDRRKKMSETVKKYKNADKTLKIIEEILDYDKNSQNFFSLASKVDKGKSVPKKQ